MTKIVHPDGVIEYLGEGRFAPELQADMVPKSLGLRPGKDKP